MSKVCRNRAVRAMTDLFNFGLALSVAAAPPKVRDEITDRMLASFRKQRQYTERIGLAEQRERSYQEVEGEMLRDHEVGEASAINGSRT